MHNLLQLKLSMISTRNLCISTVLCLNLFAINTAIADSIPSQTTKRIPWIKAVKIIPLKSNLEIQYTKKVSKKIPIASANILFKQAFNNLKESKYKSAIQNYKLILKHYPNSQYIADSHFWVAEASFLSGDFKSALKQYIFIRQNYPETKNAINAELKIAQTYYQMKEWLQAHKAFQKIIINRPNTIIAEHAKKQLNIMKRQNRK